MIAYLLQATVCLGLFYGFYHLALRRETLFAVNRAYLLSTLLAGLAIPLLQIPLDRPVIAPVLHTAIQAGTRVGDWPEVVIRASGPSTLDMSTVALGIYAAIALLLLIRLGAGLVRILRITRTGRFVDVQGSRCLLSDRIDAPFSFGQTIYLPAGMTGEDQVLGTVLRHEQAHVRQGHTADVIALEVLSAVLWIVPFIHLYRRAIRDVHEFAADAAVLRDTDWESYARLLIALKRSGGHPAVSHSFHSSTLKNRIMMMHRRPSARRAALKYTGILPVLAIAVAGFAFTHGPEITYPAKAAAGLLSGRDAPMLTGAQDDPVMPLFPGCGASGTPEDARSCSQARLVSYVREQLEYPVELWKAEKEGQVMVRFTVDAEGWVRDAEVVQGLAKAADDAALGVVTGMNMRLGPWTPGTKNGLPVATTLTLPVDFRLPAKGIVAHPAQVDLLPVYPGCNALPAPEQDVCTSTRLGQFIFTQMTYPEAERKRGIEGRGVVTFVIGTDGRLRDILLKESVSPGIDAEILRIADELAKLPNPWTPAMRDGEPVAMEMTLPILFKLSE